MERPGKSSELTGWIRGEEGLSPAVDDMLRKAYEEASTIGKIIGIVSRYSDVKTEASTRIIFEVDPSTYYSAPPDTYRIGSYVSIVDPKTMRVQLARITSVTRRDQLASIGVEPPLSSYNRSPDPQSLLTTTLVEAELLMEADLREGGEPIPAVTAVEPQSPVIDPEPRVISRLLDLPGEGVILGALSTPAGPVKGGVIPVKLPYRSLLQHTLILGTTGSGKTTLMKNMIASIVSDPKGPLVIVVDMNQDFTQLPLPPSHSLESDDVYKGVYKGVRRPISLIVVTAVTRDIIRSIIESGVWRENNDIRSVFLEVAKRYYKDTYTPLTGLEYRGPLNVRERDGTFLIEVAPEWGRLVFIPYIISTIDTHTDKLVPLMPGMTTLARELLRRVRERYYKLHGAYAPLQPLSAALLSYLEGQQLESTDLDEAVIMSSMLPYIVADKGDDLEKAVTFKIEGLGHSMVDAVGEYFDLIYSARPHRGTVEALYRRVTSLLDSDIVDIAVSVVDERVVRIIPEPSWRSIIEEASSSKAPVVLDLGWGSNWGGIGIEGSKLVTYRMLDNLISWKHHEWANRKTTRSLLVFVDEAHQFFPQEGGSREDAEANRQLASMISRIARLGRARGIGLVFSTHSPKDLHDIIIQLANTKIMLRTEKQHAEKLDVPGEVKALLSRLPDRTMYILSHVFKEGYIMAKTSRPISAHFDISAYTG